MLIITIQGNQESLSNEYPYRAKLVLCQTEQMISVLNFFTFQSSNSQTFLHNLSVFMRLRAQLKKLAKLQVSLRLRKFLVAKQPDMPCYQTSETLNLRRSIVSTTGKTEKCIYMWHGVTLGLHYSGELRLIEQVNNSIRADKIGAGRTSTKEFPRQDRYEDRKGYHDDTYECYTILP